MRALTVTGRGHVTCGPAPTESVAAGEVRVGVAAVGLCGTDFALVSGTLGLNSFPVIPGHEVSGTVLESRSRLLEVGQKVILDPLLSCGKCWACAQRSPQFCDEVRVVGVATDGACRDEVVSPGERWVPIPMQLSLEDAALVEPVHVATSTFRALAAHHPDSVLVLGAGAIGAILMVLLRHWRPATAVFVADLVPERATLAAAWGARDVSDLHGAQVDCVVDGVGSPESIQLGVANVRRGGALVVYGVPKSGASLPSADEMFRRNLRVVFTRLYDRDFSAAVGAIRDGVVSAAGVVGTRLTLESAADFLNNADWQRPSHWGKALVILDGDRAGNAI
ncbi:MAG: zinc-dependent alcohol dehydrogenase [Candidatus Dormibacteria bacterium]